jgi:hypothetical protein
MSFQKETRMKGESKREGLLCWEDRQIEKLTDSKYLPVFLH